MRRVLTTGAALALSTTTAMAGGIERSTQSVAILFEEGNYAEFSLGYFDPKVTAAPGIPSGDMAPSYTTYSLGYKQALRDNLDLAVILDEPAGAKVAYPAGTPYPLQGATAEINTMALTALLRYKFPSNVSVYGGLRAQSADGQVSLPFLGGYTMNTNTDTQLGYVLGVAWEKPEIAARVALTYNSEIEHEFNSVEFGAIPGQFRTKIPQSWNLEFQSGVAQDTLVFGSIRWVDWTALVIDPPNYPIPTNLVDYQSDSTTYTLGVGRRFSDSWSGAMIFSHEPSSGDISGNLGPTDGFSSVSLAGTYTNGNMKITGGVRYVDIGGTTTSIGVPFTNNSGVGVGLRVGYSF